MAAERNCQYSYITVQLSCDFLGSFRKHDVAQIPNLWHLTLMRRAEEVAEKVPGSLLHLLHCVCVNVLNGTNYKKIACTVKRELRTSTRHFTVVFVIAKYFEIRILWRNRSELCFAMITSQSSLLKTRRIRNRRRVSWCGLWKDVRPVDYRTAFSFRSKWGSWKLVHSK